MSAARLGLEPASARPSSINASWSIVIVPRSIPRGVIRNDEASIRAEKLPCVLMKSRWR